jgi:hypothetical protein
VVASYELNSEYPSDLRGDGTVEGIEAHAIGNLGAEMNKVTTGRRGKSITWYLGYIDMLEMAGVLECVLGEGGQ